MGRREAFAWGDGGGARFTGAIQIWPLRGHPAIELLKWRGNWVPNKQVRGIEDVLFLVNRNKEMCRCSDRNFSH